MMTPSTTSWCARAWPGGLGSMLRRSCPSGIADGTADSPPPSARGRVAGAARVIRGRTRRSAGLAPLYEQVAVLEQRPDLRGRMSSLRGSSALARCPSYRVQMSDSQPETSASCIDRWRKRRPARTSGLWAAASWLGNSTTTACSMRSVSIAPFTRRRGPPPPASHHHASPPADLGNSHGAPVAELR